MAEASDEKKQQQQYPNYIGKTNDIEKELSNLKKIYGKSYSELYARNVENVAWFDYKDKTIATVTIMQFNMLADGLSGIHVRENAKDATSQKKTFLNVPKESLVFAYRGFRILEEIARHEPDIICLQECDQFDFLLHYLSPLGFKGEFNPKASSPCLSIAKAHNITLNADGVAIFYSSKFQLKVVQKFGKSIEKIEVDIPAINILLTHLKSDKDFIVTCCHLKSTKNLKGERIRLQQLQHLLPITRQLSTSALSSSASGVIPVFVACDLNTNNNETYSTVYDSIMFPRKVKSDKKKDDKGLKPEMPKDYVDGYDGLDLWSAYYSHSIPNTEKKKDCEPPYTTYKKRANGVSKHCIDYIFYQKSKANVVRLLSIPPIQKINPQTLLPGFEYPSDHIAIQASFQF